MIIIGHEPFEVQPIRPLNAIRLLQVMAPYADRITLDQENFIESLFTFFLKLTEEPQLAIKVYSLIIDKDFQWILDNAEVDEIAASLVELNSVNSNLMQFFYEMLYMMTIFHVK